jgi:hypothetical protein
VVHQEVAGDGADPPAEQVPVADMEDGREHRRQLLAPIHAEHDPARPVALDQDDVAGARQAGVVPVQIRWSPESAALTASGSELTRRPRRGGQGSVGTSTVVESSSVKPRRALSGTTFPLGERSVNV